MRYLTLVVVLLFGAMGAKGSAALELNGLWAEAGKAYEVDPTLLFSFALIESQKTAGRGLRTVWPWTIRAGNQALRFDTKAEAAAALQNILSEGNIPLWQIDVGFMQLNLKWTWVRRGYNKLYTAEELLEPQINLGIAAEIISGLVKHGVTSERIGLYNTNDAKGGKAYGDKVLETYYSLKNIKMARGSPADIWR
jgi:hypothetical protein